MIIETNPAHISANSTNAVIALGNFDGVHLGHQEVIETAISMAQQHNTKAAVLTFSPNPAQVLNPSRPHLAIASPAQQEQLLADLGVDLLFRLNFTPEFAQITAEDFIVNILHQQLQAKHIVSGHNFHFGHKRLGDGAMLHSFAQQGYFGYTQVAGVSCGAHAISSSNIKEYLRMGAVGLAAKLLGRPYTITGTVVHGKKQASNLLGVPTANIALPSGMAYPMHGVYLVSIFCGGEEYKGIANLGQRPTLASDAQNLLETHIFDYSGNLYGKELTVQFLMLMRPEVQFANVDLLREQIERDCSTARYVLNNL